MGNHTYKNNIYSPTHLLYTYNGTHYYITHTHIYIQKTIFKTFRIYDISLSENLCELRGDINKFMLSSYRMRAHYVLKASAFALLLYIMLINTHTHTHQKNKQTHGMYFLCKYFIWVFFSLLLQATSCLQRKKDHVFLTFFVFFFLFFWNNSVISAPLMCSVRTFIFIVPHINNSRII